MIGVYINKSWTWKFHLELKFFNVIFYSPITLDEQCTLFTYLVHLYALEDFV